MSGTTVEELRADLESRPVHVTDAEYERYLEESGIGKILADCDAVLLIVDYQFDFINSSNEKNISGVNLNVAGGDKCYGLLKRLQEDFGADRVFYTADWHPENSRTFAVNAGVDLFKPWVKDGVTMTGWPVHCVQGTPGAEIAIPVLNPDHVIRKGTNPDMECYSGCKDLQGVAPTFDRGVHAGKTLIEVLRDKKVVVAGLAEDYCVSSTLRDLVESDQISTVYFSPNLSSAVAPGNDAGRIVPENFSESVAAEKLAILPYVNVKLCSKAECDRQDVPVIVVDPLFLDSLSDLSQMLHEYRLFAQRQTLEDMCASPHLYQIVPYTGTNEGAASSHSYDGQYDPHKRAKFSPN